MVLTLFGISIIIFMLLRLTPGNIADILFDAGGFVDPADKARIEADLGLDRPIPVQYAKWIGCLLQGDLGISYQTERPALQEIAPRIPITARLAALALAFAVLLGVPFGVISAVKQDTKLDYVLRVISLTGLSMPAFWLGLLILMGFVAYFGTIPIYSDAPTGFWNALLMYSVPAAAVGFRSSALMMRLTRSSMLEVLRQDYIRTARSKGASEVVINYYHALKNAMLPVVTVIGIEAAFLLGGLIVTETVFLFAAVLAPYITPYDPLSTNAAASLARPSMAHWLGCDFMGRDVWSRIIYGARISLMVSFGSMLLGSGIGVTLGLLSGYLLGWFDLITQRVLEMMQALPLLVMAIIMAAALGPSLHNTIIAIAIPLVPYVARVIRSNTLTLREQPFVEAAKAIGMPELRIAIRHVLPNTMSPLIVLATAQLGSAILVEATLSFLGLGVPEPHPSWARMLSESAAEYVRTAPWLVIFPGLAISFVVFGVNLLGDALRDLLDPRQRS